MITAKQIADRVKEIEEKEPLTIQQILNIDMLDYKQQLFERAQKELKNEQH